MYVVAVVNRIGIGESVVEVVIGSPDGLVNRSVAVGNPWSRREEAVPGWCGLLRSLVRLGLVRRFERSDGIALSLKGEYNY